MEVIGRWAAGLSDGVRTSTATRSTKAAKNMMNDNSSACTVFPGVPKSTSLWGGGAFGPWQLFQIDRPTLDLIQKAHANRRRKCSLGVPSSANDRAANTQSLLFYRVGVGVPDDAVGGGPCNDVVGGGDVQSAGEDLHHHLL